jgi:Tol biopolymer transport system component
VGGYPCAISGDGRWAGFIAYDPALVVGLPNVVLRAFLHDRQTGSTLVVAQRSDGYIGLSSSQSPTLSTDGGVVAFQYDGNDLGPTDTNSWNDVYVRVLATGAIELVNVSSTGIQSNAGGDTPVITGNGRFVLFRSGADNLVPGATGSQIYIKDRQSSILSCVTVATPGGFGNQYSERPSASVDGQFVAYQTFATNLNTQPSGPLPLLLLHDRVAGTHTQVVVSALGQQPNATSDSPAISGDGRYVAFVSAASNLVVNDTNGVRDVFVYERVTGAVTRVSTSSAGIQANAACESPSLSHDGNVVGFLSLASNLVSGDTWGLRDAFVRSRSQSLTTRVSVSSAGVQANNDTDRMVLAGNGRDVAFLSSAGNLVPNDTNGAHDCFVHTIGCATPESYCTAGTTTGGCTPFMSSVGTASLTAGSGFDISINQLDGSRFGLIYYGFTPTAVSWAIGSTSFTCIAPPVQRTAIVGSGGTPGRCNGGITLDFNAFIAANPNALGAPYSSGQVFYAQGWFRDPGAVKGTNLSDGLRFTLCD